MADESAGVGRQIALAAHADSQLAHGPGIGQLDRADRHCPGVALDGGRGDDPDADIAFDQPANGVEASELHPQFEAAADPLGLFG